METSLAVDRRIFEVNFFGVVALTKAVLPLMLQRKGGRFVVVGDSEFITNELASAPVLNADLFLNMVNWVAQDEGLIGIRPREPEDRRILLSSQQMTNVLIFSLLIVPGAVLVTGISVWWGRR